MTLPLCHHNLANTYKKGTEASPSPYGIREVRIVGDHGRTLGIGVVVVGGHIS